MKKNNKFKIIFFSTFALGLILFSGFFIFGEQLGQKDKFANGTTINGIDVSGLGKEQAQNLIATRLTSSRADIEIVLKYKDRQWKFLGEDFELDNQVMPVVGNIYDYYNSGNIVQRKIKLNKLKGDKSFNVSYSKVLSGLDEKIAFVASEIDCEPVDAYVEFLPEQEDMFIYHAEQVGLKVNQEQLAQDIDCALTKSTKAEVEIPVEENQPQISKDMLPEIVKRSEFSTSYKSSTADRKHNVSYALSKFNGMVVKPGEQISFNQTTGARTEENGYKKANVILNGVYVEGTGGGVCQASTTLYNALILSDLEIVEVNPHSLPSSYVPLAFDAMVSEGYADLVFVNNTKNNIYIKTYANSEKVFVEIYGDAFEDGVSVVRRADFVGALAHPGDRIVPDTKGEYSNKVTFKGEYLRLKYPQEGYHSKAYLDYYKNGEKIGEKLLRDEIYKPQEGIIIEGTEELYEGMTLPPNDVKFIPPQEKSNISEDNVENKINEQNPSNLNP